MKWGRIILATIVVTVFQAIWGMVTCGWLFNWIYMLEPVSIWTPQEAMTGQFWGILHGGNLLLTFFLVLVFALVHKAIVSKCACCTGMKFGLFVWLIGVLPGMFAMHMFMVVNPTVIAYWTISGLVNLLITGAIIAGIYGGNKESCCCS